MAGIRRFSIVRFPFPMMGLTGGRIPRTATTAGLVSGRSGIGQGHGISAAPKVLAAICMVFFSCFGDVHRLGLAYETEQEDKSPQQESQVPEWKSNGWYHREWLEQCVLGAEM